MPDTTLAFLLDSFVRRIDVSLQDKAADFDPERIGRANSMILLALAETGRMTMKDLTTLLARDKSQMTRAVKALVEKNMVTRHDHETDGRICEIELSQSGHDFVKVVHKELSETIEEILAPIPKGDKDSLIQILQKIRERT